VNSQLLTILALLGLYSWAVGKWARKRARRSPQTRTFFLWGSLLAIPAGVCIAFILPEQIPFNRESPAGIFTVYLPCFAIGGGLAFGGLGAFFGALFAKPEE
jgi:hypothetical protein